MKRLLQLLCCGLVSTALPAQCPVIQNCPGQPAAFCDLSPNDALAWNTPGGFFDWTHGTADLAETPAELSLTVADACLPADRRISFVLLLDLDGSGSPETAVWSDSLPPAGSVYINNVQNPHYSGGDLKPFDNRPLPANQKYRFVLEESIAGDLHTGRVRWSTLQAQSVYADPQLPNGTHKIRWFIESGGVKDTCERTIVVSDCKKPTVVCIPGLSVNIMPTCMITLWASDFLQYTEDNITPENQLTIAMRKSGTGTGFPVDGQGNPITSVTFTCDELGTQLVEIWSIDKAENADFCETYVLVQDNMGNCGGPVAVIACAKSPCSNETIADVSYTLTGSGSGIPAFVYNSVSPNGCFNNPVIPFSSNSIITPVKDDNPLNGVSTYDLVLISKHILGLETLNAPWKFIAADANKNYSITTSDIVELRKLILGLNSELPNNTSWRFYPEDFVFQNPLNPLQGGFPENIAFNMINILTPQIFIGVKIGDVNCSAIPNVADPAEERAAYALLLPDAPLAPGESIDIPVSASSAAEWLGFQLALQYDQRQLLIEKIIPGALPGLDENSFGRSRPEVLAVSWSDGRPHRLQAGERLFTLRLRALAPVNLAEAIQLSSGRLAPEAYAENEFRQPLQLEFQPAPAMANGLTVYAARPNPTSGGAVVPLELTSAGAIRLDVFDGAGKTVYSFEDQLDAGDYRLDIPAIALQVPGIYGWKLQSGSGVVSGKLVKQAE